jgi:hypothetical protein
VAPLYINFTIVWKGSQRPPNGETVASVTRPGEAGLNAVMKALGQPAAERRVLSTMLKTGSHMIAWTPSMVGVLISMMGWNTTCSNQRLDPLMQDRKLTDDENLLRRVPYVGSN